MASSVSRFSVKPNTCIRKTAPIRDTGMATTGTSTVRSEPRNRKMTTMTISDRLDQRPDHLVDGVVDVLGGVEGDLGLHAARQLALDRASISSRTRSMTSRELALGSTQTPMNTALLPGQRTVLVVVSAPSSTSATSSRRTSVSPSSLHDELLELLDAVQVGGGA